MFSLNGNGSVESDTDESTAQTLAVLVDDSLQNDYFGDLQPPKEYQQQQQLLELLNSQQLEQHQRRHYLLPRLKALYASTTCLAIAGLVATLVIYAGVLLLLWKSNYISFAQQQELAQYTFIYHTAFRTILDQLSFNAKTWKRTIFQQDNFELRYYTAAQGLNFAVIVLYTLTIVFMHASLMLRKTYIYNNISNTASGIFTAAAATSPTSNSKLLILGDNSNHSYNGHSPTSASSAFNRRAKNASSSSLSPKQQQQIQQNANSPKPIKKRVSFRDQQHITTATSSVDNNNNNSNSMLYQSNQSGNNNNNNTDDTNTDLNGGTIGCFSAKCCYSAYNFTMMSLILCFILAAFISHMIENIILVGFMIPYPLTFADLWAIAMSYFAALKYVCWAINFVVLILHICYTIIVECVTCWKRRRHVALSTTQEL